MGRAVSATWNVKICDFGRAFCTREESPTHVHDHSTMPVRWMPPEVLSSNSYSHGTDVWSFGVTCFEVFSFAQKPYASLSNEQVEAAVLAGKTPHQPKFCPDGAFALMAQTWRFKPSNRPIFANLEAGFSDLETRVRHGCNDADLVCSAGLDVVYGANKMGALLSRPQQPSVKRTLSQDSVLAAYQVNQTLGLVDNVVVLEPGNVGAGGAMGDSTL